LGIIPKKNFGLEALERKGDGSWVKGILILTWLEISLGKGPAGISF